MKILLDECVTKRLRPYLPLHQVYTVTEMQWNGLKNGNLLAKCSEQSFDILLTIDKNIEHQQNIKQYPVAIVVFNTTSSKIEELIKFIPSFNASLPAFEKGRLHIVER